MKASVPRAPLLAALTRIAGVVERRQTIPILGSVLVVAEDGALRLRGTDLDMEAVEVVAADVDEPGATAVEAGRLLDIARNTDASAASFERNGSDPRLIVKVGRSRFNMPTLAVDDFPRFQVAEIGAGWSFPAKTLADMIGRVDFARGASSVVNAFSGTYLTTVDGSFRAVAACGSGLAMREEPAPEAGQAAAILLSKATGQIAKWLSSVDGDCTIRSSGTLVQIEAGGSILTTKVFDGPYVQYERVLMRTHRVAARTDRDALALALRQVLIMTEGKGRSVRFRFSDGAITLSARGAMSGDGIAEVAAEYDGPDAEFLLIADLVSSALQSLAGDIVEIAFAPSFTADDNKSGQVVISAPCDAGMVVNLMQARA